MRFVKIEQRALVSRQAKKVVLLACALERVTVRATRVGDFFLGEIRFVVRTVPPGKFAEVDVVGVALEHATDDLVHPHPMPPLGRANEIVVADAQLLPQTVMIGDHAVGELDWENSLFGRRPLDALSVFVRSGEK